MESYFTSKIWMNVVFYVSNLASVQIWKNKNKNKNSNGIYFCEYEAFMNMKGLLR